jgi:two-component system, response regulator PdtaR
VIGHNGGIVEDVAKTPSAGQMHSKGRILVVDDDRLVLATVTHGLSQAGYEVIDADNGDDAILLAREHRPQLALLDIRMEGKSGFDVAETLRDAYAIPFMFLSAFADPATLAKVQALGAQAYLIKPLDVGQIVPSVAAVLARLQSAGPVAAPPKVTAPAAPGLPDAAAAAASTFTFAPATGADPVPIAVGILMHRYSLARGAALQRLQRLAQDNQLGVPAQAERLLLAVEELARSAL